VVRFLPRFLSAPPRLHGEDLALLPIRPIRVYPW
jgi:hypothetical protein